MLYHGVRSQHGSKQWVPFRGTCRLQPPNVEGFHGNAGIRRCLFFDIGGAPHISLLGFQITFGSFTPLKPWTSGGKLKKGALMFKGKHTVLPNTIAARGNHHVKPRPHSGRPGSTFGWCFSEPQQPNLCIKRNLDGPGQSYG